MGMFIKFECSKCGEYECDCSYEERIGASDKKRQYQLLLSDYVFNFNPYTNKWRATTRQYYIKMFSNSRAKEVLSADTIDELIEQIKMRV